MGTNWMIAVIAVAISQPVWGQAQADDRYPITSRTVARALSNNGMETADEQVSLPAQVVASEPHPALDILSVEPVPGTEGGKTAEVRSMVRLACRTPQSCLPFFAVVTGPQVVVPPSNAPGVRNAAPVVANAKPVITMRAGTHAVLVMDDSLAHIQVAVITLENGSTGKWIRVASPDRKQYYTAEVISATQLRGEF